MSTYDIAAGASSGGLNALVAELYANAAARQKLFAGTVTKTLTTGIGVTATYDVKAVPTFQLAAPTQEQWDQAQKTPHDAPLPTTNVFQLVLSDIAISVQMTDVDPLKAEGAVTAIGTAVFADNNVTLRLAGLILDESSLSVFDTIVVNEVLLPALTDLVNKAVSGLPLPQLPTFEGFSFQSPVLAISPAGLVVASSLTDDPAPDLGGFTFPDVSLFVLARGTAINRVLAKAVPSSVRDEKSTGPTAWSASGRVTASNLTVAVGLSDGLTIDVDGSFAAYGELSGTGVGVTKAVLCPIGAAADAIADPSNWDKVITSFELTGLPHPMPIPVDVKVGAIAGAGVQQTQAVTVAVPSDKLPASIKPMVAPTWSGSVTGVVLSAAAAAFVDLILLIFDSVVIKTILAAVGPQTFALPVGRMKTTISLPDNGTLTLQLSAPPDSSLQSFGGDQLLAPVQITIA